MKASRAKKKKKRRATLGEKIENNHKKEASGSTLIILPNSGLIDVYRKRHFCRAGARTCSTHAGTSVICCSPSLFAGPSSRCDENIIYVPMSTLLADRSQLSRIFSRPQAFSAELVFVGFQLFLFVLFSHPTCYPSAQPLGRPRRIIRASAGNTTVEAVLRRHLCAYPDKPGSSCSFTRL